MTKLEARKRETSAKDFTEVLAVVYGNKKDPVSLVLNYTDFEKVYKEAGTSSVITLSVEGDEKDVIIKDIQIDPRKDRIHHVDFYEVTKGEEMEATVSLNFTGEAPAEKLGMVLNTAKTEVEIKAMPKDLPSEIDVDLSVLVDGDSVIRLKDLNLPADVKLVGDEEEVVVSVVEAKADEEEATETEESVENEN